MGRLVSTDLAEGMLAAAQLSQFPGVTTRIVERRAGRLAIGEDGLVPCTPLGCLMLLKDRLGDLSGLEAVVVGRSNIVGKPLALMLIARGATVTVCNSKTPDLASFTRSADILIAAAGRAKLVTRDMISQMKKLDPNAPDFMTQVEKLGGESALGPDDTVVRTSWVCGRQGRNFVKTILGRAADGHALTVVDDQHGCPSFTEDLAGMIRHLAVARLPGTFHVTNQGPTTWYGFAHEIFALARVHGRGMPGLRPIASVNNMLQCDPRNRSTYHGGTLRLQQRFSNGALFLVSYTYGKSLDYGGSAASGGGAPSQQEPSDDRREQWERHTPVGEVRKARTRSPG